MSSASPTVPSSGAGADASGMPAGLGSLFGGPNGPNMGDLMKYLPTILKIANNVPGVVVGFVFTLVYLLAFVGRADFRETVAPVAGFHLVVFFLLRELFGPWREGQQRAAVVRQRVSNARAFTSDIGMQYREKLD